MLKIEEKMYVRTRNGIAKILGIINDPDNFYYKMLITDKFLKIHDDTEYINDLDVIKASSNIIDLIEENDLVKIEYYSLRYEKRVTRLFEVDYIDKEYLVSKNAYCTFRLKNNEWSKSDKKLKPIVKEILTKEQYENNCYKVEE